MACSRAGAIAPRVGRRWRRPDGHTRARCSGVPARARLAQPSDAAISDQHHRGRLTARSAPARARCRAEMVLSSAVSTDDAGSPSFAQPAGLRPASSPSRARRACFRRGGRPAWGPRARRLAARATHEMQCFVGCAASRTKRLAQSQRADWAVGVLIVPRGLRCGGARPGRAGAVVVSVRESEGHHRYATPAIGPVAGGATARSTPRCDFGTEVGRNSTLAPPRASAAAERAWAAATQLVPGDSLARIRPRAAAPRDLSGRSRVGSQLRAEHAEANQRVP